MQTRGRDVLDRQLLAAGASKTEHVVHLTLNPAQTFLYQALLKVWISVNAVSCTVQYTLIHIRVFYAAIQPPAPPQPLLVN